VGGSTNQLFSYFCKNKYWKHTQEQNKVFKMPRDRLAELRQKAQLDDSSTDVDETGGIVQPNGFGETVIQMEDLAGNGISDFFVQAEDLRKLIYELKGDVEQVEKLHSRILNTPVPDEKSKIDLDKMMATIKTSSQVIRAKLKDIERGIQSEELKGEAVTANLRIRKTQHSGLLRTFIEVMNTYQLSQTTYRDRCKSRIKRQLDITGSQFSEDEVEEMIEKGNWAVFTQGIIMETEQARQMLADVEARHNDILNLEKSLRELHDLFLEMAILVESQGETIDRIETNVTNTQDYVHKAVEQTGQALQLQVKARKKKIWIIIFILIVILVLILIIYFSF